MGFLDWFEKKSEQLKIESFFKQAINIYNKWHTTYASHGSDNPHMFACLKAFEIHSSYYKINSDKIAAFNETIPFNALSKEEGLELLPYLLAYYTRRDFADLYYSHVAEKTNVSISRILNDKKYLELKETIVGNDYIIYTVWFGFLDDNLLRQLKTNL